MKLSDRELEARLRRTFAAVVEAPLDGPGVTAVPPRSRGRTALVVTTAAAAVAALVVVGLVQRDDRVTTLADGATEGRVVLGYLPTDAEAALLFRAEQRLVRSCMESTGQPYVEVAPTSDGLEADWSRLGRTDPQRADRLGYVLPAGPGGRNPVQDTLTTDRQRDAWSLALTGEPYSAGGGPSGPSVPIVDPTTGQETGRQGEGGCFGRMQRELYDDQSRHSSLEMWIANDFRGEVERRAVEDRRFQDAVRTWSSCMRDRGHDYDDPFGPVNEFNDGDVSDRPTERERVVARADVECKNTTGLVRSYRDLEAEYARAIVAGNGHLLAEYRQIVDRALAVARAVLATPNATTTTRFDVAPAPG